MTQKINSRKAILSKRKNLDKNFREKTSQTICEIIIELEEFKKAKKIALYISANGEIDPSSLLSVTNKHFYLPILDPEKPNHLLFQSYDKNETLKKNRYGIPEPKLDTQKLINPTDLDCVLTPLVGFDKKGNRLGMGVGYYDRSFSFLQNKKRPHKPLLIGLAYAFQEIPDITAEDWDVALDVVVTEKDILKL